MKNAEKRTKIYIGGKPDYCIQVYPHDSQKSLKPWRAASVIRKADIICVGNGDQLCFSLPQPKCIDGFSYTHDSVEMGHSRPDGWPGTAKSLEEIFGIGKTFIVT